MEQVDCVVVGAGVVGLAVARALALKGREVMVLESAAAIGTATSSRNSEVIHAGIYYRPGSLKAKLCVLGKQMLYTYCAERGIGFRRCGKLIVATSRAQVDQLEGIQRAAAANGVHDLVALTRDEALTLEPQLECVAALLSPGTGIVDSHGLMLALQGDLENTGRGMVVLNAPVDHARCTADGIAVVTQDGTHLMARSLVNAAGLSACALARRFEGLDSRFVPTPYFAKGSYFVLSGRNPFRRLVYPVPEPGGLGVHLTIDLGGQAKFGPDVQWVHSPDDTAVGPARGESFYAEVRKYWPALADDALIPGYAGIRPKVSGPHEAPADFIVQGPAVHGVAGLVNLFGIESPGLTSSLAIGAMVADMLA